MSWASDSEKWFKTCLKWDRQLLVNGSEVRCIVSKTKIVNGFEIVKLTTSSQCYNYKKFRGSHGPYFGPKQLFLYDRYGDFLETFSWVTKDPFSGKQSQNQQQTPQQNSGNIQNESNHNNNIVPSADDDIHEADGSLTTNIHNTNNESDTLDKDRDTFNFEYIHNITRMSYSSCTYLVYDMRLCAASELASIHDNDDFCIETMENMNDEEQIQYFVSLYQDVDVQMN
eukprot:296153_1